MQIIRSLKPNTINKSSLALGVFDGVHLGHQQVIFNAINKAKELNAVSAVVTFLDHPQAITAKTPAKLITSFKDRLKWFEKLGVEVCVVLEFNREFSDMSAGDYIEKILVNSLGAKNISIGYDHRFGADKKGDSTLLQEYGEKCGFNTDVIPAFIIDGQVVSSSIIRKYIALGKMDTAYKFLGRPFSIKGTVIKGEQRGRILGFPTANLQVPEKLICPKTGVYSAITEIDNVKYKSVVNIGKRPTYNDIDKILIENHILEFSGDLYGKEIEILFLELLRNEIKFSSEEALKEQIKKDCSIVMNKINL